MDAHSPSAGCSNSSSSRYHGNLDLTSQEWHDLHLPLSDTPIFSFTQPETPFTEFITSSEPINPPSTSTFEVSTFTAEGKI